MKQLDLERMARAVGDAEHRWEQAKATCVKVNGDIQVSERMLEELEANLIALRRDKLIVVASEYRKARNDIAHLKHAMVRLRTFKIDREQFALDCEKHLKQAIKDFKAMEEFIANQVIRVNFGSKNGQG